MSNKKVIPIQGMHCRSCEILIEEELLKIKNIKKVNVSEKSGTAEIYYDNEFPDKNIENAVTSCGYKIGDNSQKTLEWISTKESDYEGLLTSIFLILIAYIGAKNFGLFDMAFNSSSNLSSAPVVFLVGITAGLSTCMALVGGLVLGVTARYNEKNPNASVLQKFRPHIMFNLGRIISFFVLGGVIGYFGSLLTLSTATIGYLIIAISLVMLVLGLQTLGIFPILEKIKLTLPKSLYKVLGIETQKQNEYSNRGALILGGLTFFLPCGFTQAMQLFAISSGSMVTGAVTMGLFALGTSIGLLSIGGITAVIKGSITKPFFKFVGLLVIAMAVFNIINALNLVDIQFPIAKSVQAESKVVDKNVQLQNNVQIVKMTQKANGYFPNKFTIKKGIPVKWVITSETPNSCAASLVSSQLKVRKMLETGENIIEFTPDKVGAIKFSCSMGMYTGLFNVVE